MNIEGLAAATGATEDAVRGYVREWQNYALAYPERERGIEGLWSVYALLRAWLLSPERLNEEDRRTAHLAAGNFLWEMVDNNKAGELGLTWVECLTETRAQYLAAGEYTLARQATNHISNFMVTQGLYKELARLNEEILRYEPNPNSMNWIGRAFDEQCNYEAARAWYQRSLEEAADKLPEEAAVAWHGLASIDLQVGDYGAADEKLQKSLMIMQQINNYTGAASTWNNLATIAAQVGDYEGAREKFQKSLDLTQKSGDLTGEAAAWHNLATCDLRVGHYEAARNKLLKALAMRQQLGSRAGEAATWHQLASIDLKTGAYEAAREKFQKSLEIKQQLGDRAGEAATLYQLGLVADKRERITQGMRLIALGFLISQSIGHSYAKICSKTLLQMAAELDYTQEQVDAMLREVSEAYEADRGWGLIEAAFKSA